MTAEAPFLLVRNLEKRFGDTVAVSGLSLSLPRGRILALLGPSGGGKTTTLRLLAGFEIPERGEVVVDGEEVTRLAPVARRIGMVFQHYALFPHLDTGENVAFGLASQGIRGAEQQRRVREALALVELEGFERRRIDQLSGGQQQRVALARALAPEPRVLLLDEPLSNLDPTLRERTRRELRALLQRIGITAVLVTHEQEEAFDLGDVVAVLQGGRLEQCGPPEDLYDRPATPFVAGFVGRGTFLPVRIVRRNGAPAEPAAVAVGGEEIVWEVPRAGAGAERTYSPGQPGRLFLRPEGVRFAPPAAGRLQAVVVERRFLGPVALFRVQLRDGATLEVSAEPDAARIGDPVGLVPAGRGLCFFPDA